MAPLPPPARSPQLECLYDCWCGRRRHKELPGEQLDVNCHHQPRDGAVLVSVWVCRNYTLPIHHTLELSAILREVFTVPGWFSRLHALFILEGTFNKKTAVLGGPSSCTVKFCKGSLTTLLLYYTPARWDSITIESISRNIVKMATLFVAVLPGAVWCNDV